MSDTERGVWVRLVCSSDADKETGLTNGAMRLITNHICVLLPLPFPHCTPHRLSHFSHPTLHPLLRFYPRSVFGWDVPGFPL